MVGDEKKNKKKNNKILKSPMSSITHKHNEMRGRSHETRSRHTH